MTKQHPRERLLVICRQHPGHVCSRKVTALSLICYECLNSRQTSDAYKAITAGDLRHYKPDSRDNAFPGKSTCACNEATGGASYTFGCTWSERTRGCKHGQARDSRGKFFPKDSFPDKSPEGQRIALNTKSIIDPLADAAAPWLQALCPEAFSAMTVADEYASSCRIGTEETCPRPFGSATFVVSYCAHYHCDVRNMYNGCTCAITILKPNPPGVRRDPPQYHLFRDYSLSRDGTRGNLALSLPDGALLIEAAKLLWHATTPVESGSRFDPERIGIILVQHKFLRLPLHGQRTEFAGRHFPEDEAGHQAQKLRELGFQ